ncbi:DUF421 domain-containing protein [Metabacillus malikii]|uniref:Uncharacterized membrane protein YcaP (DUF421 family) n=1 Tax=Metabacillus malikii TaxID=1504265 RepID=A0ABT9ZIC1_9BACI|nr:DUF421 domain-containing protein [Metabacillus malikii]MDQ0232031.1 uncharacterized membrane protein YcaP (DUF421 family) [Metabacillus malikii]
MVDMKDILLVIGRIFTILPLLLVATLFMGKRSIGELPVFDFLVIITLGAVVGADIADPEIEHLPTAVTVIVLAAFQKMISKLIIRYRKVGRLLTFEPTIVIVNGTFINKNLKKIQYSLDNLLSMLREKEIFDVSTVQLGIIEPNGNLSIFKKDEYTSVTRQDFKLQTGANQVSYPVIIEGKVDKSTLHYFKVEETWLFERLKKQGLKVDEIFYASLNANLDLHLSPKTNEMPQSINH